MAIPNLDSLPDSVSSGQVGHIESHQDIHAALKAVKGEVEGRLSDATLNATYAPVSGSAAYLAATTIRPHKTLFPALTKLANASREKFVLAYYGDSLGEGVGANTFGGRFPAQLQKLLTSRYAPDVPVSEVFVPPARSSNVPTAVGDFVKSGSTSATGRGPRPTNVVLLAGATPGTVTGTFTGTQFRLFFYRLVNSTVLIDIDGTVTSLDLTAATREIVWTSPVLASGSHTVTVTASVDQTTFCGMERIDHPTDKGVHVWDLSVSGMQANHLANTGSGWPGSEIFANWIGIAFTPDMVVCHLYINDAGNGRTSAQYKADMQSIITKIRAKTTAPILLLPPWVPTNVSDTWAEGRGPYMTALRELAAANAGVVFRDLGEAVPTHTAAEFTGIYNGSPHMTDRGQAFHARAAADAFQTA